MQKVRDSLRIFLLYLFMGFIHTSTAVAQNPEENTIEPSWRFYNVPGGSQIFDQPEMLFNTPQEACIAGVAYFMSLPRAATWFNGATPLTFNRIGPLESVSYVNQFSTPFSAYGHKCIVNLKGVDGITRELDWFEDMAAFPICPDGTESVNVDNSLRCGIPVLKAAPDCEGTDGDSPKSAPPKKCAGNPIAVDSGAKQHRELDYATADGLMQVERMYRSNLRPHNLSKTSTEVPGFGLNWRGLIPGRITLKQDFVWNAEYLNEEGGVRRFSVFNSAQGGLAFRVSGVPTRLKLEFIQPVEGTMDSFATAQSISDGPGELRLVYSSGDYVIFRRSGAFHLQSKTRHFVPIEHGLANGYKRWIDYPDTGQYPNRIRDNLGREMAIDWTETGWASEALRGYYKSPNQPAAPNGMVQQKAISTITLPDTTRLSYTYSASGDSGFLGRLDTARRLDASNNVLWGRTYLYEDARFRTALTGMLDQNGSRLSTYTYAADGKAASTERADGFDRQTVSYSTGPESPDNYDRPVDIRDVTNPLGMVTRYTYSAYSENYSSGESPGPDPRITPRRLLNIQGSATANLSERTQIFGYDDNGLRAGGTDANGNQRVQQNIAEEGRPSETTDATGVTTQIEWHPTFDLPVRTIRKQLQKDYSYDAQGQLISASETDLGSGAARSTQITPGTAGRMLVVNGPRAPDALGRDDITTMTYDAQGNLLTMSNALGHVTSYEGYDANGRPARTIDPNGIITAFTYDPLGRVKTIRVKHPSDAARDALTSMDYDVEGRVTTIARPDTAPLRFDYNLAGLPTAIRSDDGERIDFTHDLMGNVTSETVKRADGTQARSVTRTFDELGRLLSLTLGPDRTTRFQYDNVGNPTKITSARGNALDQAFDALNRLVSTLAPDGGISGYGYVGGTLAATGGGTVQETVTSGDGDSPASELGAFRDPNGVTTRFTRNAFGQVTEEVSPDRGTIRYEYDAAGDLAASIDGRGQRIVFVRDILGRVVSKTPVGRPASEQVTYIYDLPLVGGSYAIGRLSRIDDGSGATRFGYDHRGNLTTRFQKLAGTPDWVALRYRYDLADRIDLITYPSGRQVFYARDAKGRVASVRTRAAATVPAWTTISSGMSYEAFGSLKAISLGNGERMVASYGDDGRLDGRRLYKTSDNANVSHLTYGYDADDNMVRITDRLNADNTLTYAYDESGRLTRVTTATGELRRTDYVYDANGNKLREFRRPLPDDPASAATIDRYTFETGSNRLTRVTTAVGNRTLTYDARGNLAGETRPGGITVNTAYDGYGRLTGYSRSGEADLTHVYNGMDDRVATTTTPSGGAADTRRFVYAPDGRVLGEYGANADDVRAEFIWMSPEVGEAGGSLFGGDDGLGGYMPLAVATADPLAGQGATQLAWVHASHMGVPIRYSDASGNTLNPPTSYSVPGFPGQSRTLSDLYYNRYRDYDPSTGRYIQADPIGLAGGAEPYGYALNNPLRYSDPTGEIVPLVILGGVALGAGTDLAIQAGMNWWNGRDVFDRDCYDWNSVAISGALGGVGGGVTAWAGRGARAAGAVADDVLFYTDDLLRAAQQKYPRKAGRIENHHVEPIYLGGARSGATTPLDSAYHQQITNAFRDLHGYGQGPVSPEVLQRLMKEVYSQFPLPPV